MGNHYPYHQGQFAVEQRGSIAVAVAVQDARDEVESGNKDPSFVGLQRAGFGNPFDVATESGRPFAEDVTTVVTRSLHAAGYQVRLVNAEVEEPAASVIKALGGTGARRLLFVHINRWKTDTLVHVGLDYAVSLQVFDEVGRPLARSVVSGHDNLGSSLLNPNGRAAEGGPNALRSCLMRLFRDRGVTAAMAVAGAPSGPSVEAPAAALPTSESAPSPASAASGNPEPQ